MAWCIMNSAIRSGSGKTYLPLFKRTFANQSTSTEESCPFNSKSNLKSDSFENAKPYEKIPGPSRLPVIGTIHHFLPGGKYYNKQLSELHAMFRKEFGRIVKFDGVLGKPDIVISYDPDDIATIFRTEGHFPIRMAFEILEYFRKHERPEVFKGLSGLVSDQGEQWYKTRTLVNPVMMQPKTVKMYIDHVERIADDFVDRIREIRDSNNEVPSDFGNEMNKWALESIAYIGLDQRLGLMKQLEKDSDGQKLIENVHQFLELTYELEFMPSPWKYIKTPAFKQMMKVLHVMTDTASKFVDEAELKLKSKTIQDTDKLSVLEKLLKLDRTIAIVMVLDMLMAGVDTTSYTAIGNFYLLAKNPEKQKILRDEIMSKLPNRDSKLNSQSMANMPYLRACMKESARIQPTSLGTSRCTGQDLVLQGYKVPKGTNVANGQVILSNDERYFAKSDQYLPERFIKSNPDNAIKSKHPFSYLPFGFGPRMCIGRRFAELEIEILLSKVIRSFEIEWHHPDMKYVSKVLNTPSGDLKFRFVDIK